MQRRPIRLADDEAAGQAVERGHVGHVERVERAEDVERGGGRLDLGVDGHRDGADRRDVLALDVGELAAPRSLNAEHRQHAQGRDDRQRQRHGNPSKTDSTWNQRPSWYQIDCDTYLMRSLMRVIAVALASVFAAGLLSTPAQLQEKGGEEETGPYAVVENWPTPWARPGYIWGSQPGIFAETPNRIFIAARGELKLPDTLPRGFNGIWGSLNQRATEPKPEMRNCIVVVDGRGKLIEAWTQWDKLFEGGGGPHKIRISPYDPERHVWVVNDARHQIYEFTNDGKQLVRTLGEADVAGERRQALRPAAGHRVAAGRHRCWSPTGW